MELIMSQDDLMVPSRPRLLTVANSVIIVPGEAGDIYS